MGSRPSAVADLLHTRSPAELRHLVAHLETLEASADPLAVVAWAVRADAEAIRGARPTRHDDRNRQTLACLPATETGPQGVVNDEHS